MRAEMDRPEQPAPQALQRRWWIIPGGISALSFALVLLHLLSGVKLDNTALVLLAFGILPWLVPFTSIRRVELPGGWKLEFQELKEQVRANQEEIDALRFLVENFVTEYELDHLRKLRDGVPFPYEKIAAFERELR